MSRSASRSGLTIASNFSARCAAPPAFSKSSKSTSTCEERPSSLTSKLVSIPFASTRLRNAAASASVATARFWPFLAQAETDPEAVRACPTTLPVGRLDETYAARAMEITDDL